MLFTVWNSGEEDKTTPLKIKKLQIPYGITVKELKSALAKIFNRLKIFKYNIDSAALRVWKLESDSTIDEFKENLHKACVSSKTYDYQFSFNGPLIDRDPNKNIEELIENFTDNLIIEINEPGKLWIFFNDLVKACKKCSACGRIDFLNYPCSCGKVKITSKSHVY